MSITLVPTENHVIVKTIKSPSEVEGIIISVDPDRERSQQAVVVAIGKGYNEITHSWYDFPNLKIGDTVLIMKHAGQDFTDDGGFYTDRSKHTTYTILNYEDIQAIIQK